MSRKPLSREPTETRIEGFTHGGEGVARIEGKAVFVPDTIPGERVVVRVVDDRRRWARARVVEVLEPSPDRVSPPCPYLHPPNSHGRGTADSGRPAGICGGCDLQHIAPRRQRALKTRVTKEQLARLGGITDPPVEATRPVGPDEGYRNRARFHAAEDGRLGFHEAGSHDVVPVDRCLVLGDLPQRVRDAVGDDSGAAEVTVRGHPAAATSAAVLRPGPGGLHLPEGEFDLLLEQPDGASIAMRGDGTLAEDVAGFRYRFDATTFFQVNTAGAAALVEQVLEATGDVDGALVWDLYAGVGLLSLPLAVRGATVTAVESGASAAEWARRNADEAGVAVEVVTSDVGAFVAGMSTPGEAYELPDAVVLDPPRTGAGAEVVAAVAALQPGVIVYVACDVAALARDARTLGEHGYRLRTAQPLDLFPHTHHVEVVARFTR